MQAGMLAWAVDKNALGGLSANAESRCGKKA
jgi:hypothetical protein